MCEVEWSKKRTFLNKAMSCNHTESQPGCRGTLWCHLHNSNVPRDVVQMLQPVLPLKPIRGVLQQITS